MTLKRLILNADDYGRSAGISRGIRQAHQHGVVSSTTCMLNFPTTAADIHTAQAETPALGLGVHLVLTAGRPLLPAAAVPTLVDAAGQFLSQTALLARRAQIDPAEVRAEWRAQVEAFCAAAGRAPTHLDSHHHTSYITPGLFRAQLELAREYGCAIRLPRTDRTSAELTGLPAAVSPEVQPHVPALLAQFAPRAPDGFHSGFYDADAVPSHLVDVLARPWAGVLEIMCHPGYSDPDLAASSSYALQREQELAALTDPSVRAAVTAHGWELVNFTALN